MQRKVLHVLVFSLLISSGLCAQTSKLKKANAFMESLNFVGAIELYEEILAENDNNDFAKTQLADAYRKIGDSQNAEYWYSQVVLNPDADAINKLYYAQMLQRNGKCTLARKWFKQYSVFRPNDRRAANLLASCDRQQELRSKGVEIFQVEPVSFNTPNAELSPTFFKSGLVFASDRTVSTRKHSWTGNSFLDLYYVSSGMDTTEICGFYEPTEPESFTKNLNTRFNEATVAFSKDENEIYFTRNDDPSNFEDKAFVPLKIYKASYNGKKDWISLESMPFNSDEYSVAHPSLSADGDRLFFASDMPGGFGGMDIYVSERKYGVWGPPTNLGANVNTEGNEVFPFYDNNSRLYFASDGHVGLGGLDILYSVNKSFNNWLPAENLGYPINTVADDFSIIFNEEGNCGYFTSNREGGRGSDDIYSFTKDAVNVQLVAYDALSGQYIENARIENACTRASMLTDEEGNKLVEMPINKCCTYVAYVDGYEPITREVCTRYTGAGESIVIEFPMGKQLDLMVSGVIFDQSNGLPIEGARVNLNTSACEVPETIVTDASGRYSFKLSKDCCYWVRAEKPNFFTRTDSKEVCTRNAIGSEYIVRNIYMQPYLNTGDSQVDVPGTYYNAIQGKYMDLSTGRIADGGYGEYKLKGGTLVGIDNIIGFRRSNTVFDNTYSVSYLIDISFDYNQSFIQDNATKELDKLLDLMKENPGLILEIGSHTDSRGPDEFNMELSQSRADAIVKWLVERGITQERLTSKGYGETRCLNKCENGVPCSEIEHQVNRRIEFRVIGCLNCEKEMFTRG